MLDWSISWLMTAGCADLKIEHSSKEGKLDSIKVRQTPFNKENIKTNKLRV